MYHVDRAATYTLQINTFFCKHNTLRKIWEDQEEKANGTPKGKGLYLTLYPKLSPYTHSI